MQRHVSGQFRINLSEPDIRPKATQHVREQILAGHVPPPRSIEPGVPEALERSCLRCLAKRPGDRYENADSLAAELWAFLDP